MLSEKIDVLKHNFQKIVEGMENYSLILLDEHGTILTWNKGAENLKGYKPEEIIGQHYSIFYLPEDRQSKLHELLIQEAREKGNSSFVGRRIRKNGSIFWGKVDMTAIKDNANNIIGFTKLSRELSDNVTLGNFWFDNDGVLNIKSIPNAHDPEAIQEFRTVIARSSNQDKLCVIADVTNAKLTESGMALTGSTASKHYKAIAFISADPHDSNTEAIISLMGTDIPAKSFDTRDRAKQWIKGYI